MGQIQSLFAKNRGDGVMGIMGEADEVVALFNEVILVGIGVITCQIVEAKTQFDLLGLVWLKGAGFLIGN
jgi:hypothetical protein